MSRVTSHDSRVTCDHPPDDERREGLGSGHAEPRPLPEPEGRLRGPVLARLRWLAPGCILGQYLHSNRLRGQSVLLSASPEVVAVERLAGELAVPQDEVDLVIGGS